MREGELLRVSNRHATALAIEERPGRYLAYFENKFGEQLVFMHEDRELDAMVFHGDVDWEPRRVTDAGGLPDVGDLVLNDEEHAFLTACWIATAWRRDDAGLLAERRSRPDPPGARSQTPSRGSRPRIRAL